MPKKVHCNRQAENCNVHVNQAVGEKLHIVPSAHCITASITASSLARRNKIRKTGHADVAWFDTCQIYNKLHSKWNLVVRYTHSTVTTCSTKAPQLEPLWIQGSSSLLQVNIHSSSWGARTFKIRHNYRPDTEEPSWWPHEAVILPPSAAVYVLHQVHSRLSAVWVVWHILMHCLPGHGKHAWSFRQAWKRTWSTFVLREDKPLIIHNGSPWAHVKVPNTWWGKSCLQVHKGIL